jgi:polyisoprenoid-binding protein YceI
MTTSKTSLYTLLAATLLAAPACQSELDDKPTAQINDAVPAKSPEAAPVAKEGDATATQTLALVGAKSSIEFVGAKVSGDHRGSFGSPTGSVQLAGDEVKAMRVEVSTTDLSIQPEKLAGHLRSPDFFDVEKYPMASFTLASVAAKGADGSTHEVTGDLELRGVKKSITFPAQVKFSEAGVAATASFKINRQDFGIVYTGMADDLIKDEVLLDLKLEFAA